VVQRVASASVRVDDRVVADIGPGLVALIGVTHTDTPVAADRMADKIWRLRIFDTPEGERSAADLGRAVLVVSQFTLYGDTRRGRRPSWIAAAPGEVAEPLVERVCGHLREVGAAVATGVFGAHMCLALVNDGPCTVVLET
jgi:D-tyrosyl-tRNA(Tyr) deacylase